MLKKIYEISPDDRYSLEEVQNSFLNKGKALCSLSDGKIKFSVDDHEDFVVIHNSYGSGDFKFLWTPEISFRSLKEIEDYLSKKHNRVILMVHHKFTWFPKMGCILHTSYNWDQIYHLLFPEKRREEELKEKVSALEAKNEQLLQEISDLREKVRRRNKALKCLRKAL
ncbi:MAG: hypothetical protein DDT23_00359 [candidate division WS2 bacterium]|nr:hypothetical protein [Candidatus Lithacetigena glycinireducens]